MMRYIIRNLKLFIIREKLFFFLIILGVFISGIMISFSYGLFCNYEAEKNSKNFELTNLQISFENDMENQRYVTKGQLENCILKFSENSNDKIECMLVEPYIDGAFNTECRFVIKDGRYRVCEVFRDNMILGNYMDTYFTEEQEAEGKTIAFVYYTDKFKMNTPILDSLITDSGYIHIQGKDYQIIGTQTWINDAAIVPFGSLNENTILGEKGLTLVFSMAITKAQYEEITTIISEGLGDLANIPPMKLSESSQMSLYNTIMIIAVLIAFIVAVNFAILYLYILLQREKELAIFRICGMSKYGVVYMYLTECLFIIIPTFIFGMVIYNWFILPSIEKVFEYMGEIYNFKVYAGLFGIFLFTSILVLGIMIAGRVFRKRILDMI